jgi:hypothetical protein
MVLVDVRFLERATLSVGDREAALSETTPGRR